MSQQYDRNLNSNSNAGLVNRKHSTVAIRSGELLKFETLKRSFRLGDRVPRRGELCQLKRRRRPCHPPREGDVVMAMVSSPR